MEQEAGKSTHAHYTIMEKAVNDYFNKYVEQIS